MTQTTTAEIPAALAGLAARLGDRLSFAASDREQFSTDFGRWRYKVPAAVARCRDAQEVAEVIRWCRSHAIPIAPRSQGHTQSGQSLTTGVLLDTAAMNRILEIDEREGWALCEAGVVWRDLVVEAAGRGFIPPVLDESVLDGKIVVDSASSFAMSKELTQREGLFVGVSCGSVVKAAIKVAERLPGEQHIVCLLADGGWKYLSSNLWTTDWDDEPEDVQSKIWW